MLLHSAASLADPAKPQYLTPAEQVRYLREQHNFQTTTNYLSNLRSIGGGPLFVYRGRGTFSTPEWLDAWIKAKTSHPISRAREYRSSAGGVA